MYFYNIYKSKKKHQERTEKERTINSFFPSISQFFQSVEEVMLQVRLACRRGFRVLAPEGEEETARITDTD